MKYLIKLIRSLWGDLSKEEYKKFAILASALMLVIGNYWMLRVTKDALFNLFVGYEKYEPIAKMVSPFVMLVVVLFYSKLVDVFKRSTLIYLMCSFYGISFIILSFFIANPSGVTISEASVLYFFVSWIPGQGIGWVAYLLLESYGSLLIALFYSFIASVMTTSLAQKGYGFMFIFIQLATVVGILIEQFVVKRAGFSAIYFIGGIFVLIAPFFIKFYISIFSEEASTSEHTYSKNNKKTGFWEGLRLTISRPYVLGILVIATFFEIIHYLIEYQMSVVMLSLHTDTEFSILKGYQGFGINLMSFIFTFVGGTSILMRKLGMKFCLITFPIAIGFIVFSCLAVYLIGVSSIFLMWFLLISSVVVRGLHYALNKPTSEVMYVPTSKDIQFKAKGWIDMFGVRATKSIGGGITLLSPLFLFSVVSSLGITVLWVFVAVYVGNTFNQLQSENKIIE